MNKWIFYAILIGIILILAVLLSILTPSSDDKAYCEKETYPSCEGDNFTMCSYVKGGDCCVRYAEEFNIEPDCYNIKRMKEAP